MYMATLIKKLNITLIVCYEHKTPIIVYKNRLSDIQCQYISNNSTLKLKVLAYFINVLISHITCCVIIYPSFIFCCCRPTHPCLFRGDHPYFEVMGHLLPVFSVGFKCPDCFIWN